MALNRKPDTSQLVDVLTYHTVDNIQTACDIAQAFMKLPYNRNLLNYREIMTNYVAAVVYTLAHNLPVPVSPYSDAANIPVAYRSKVGDIPHLIVLLSHQPQIVAEVIARCPKANEWYQRCCTTDFDKLKPLAANMNRLLHEGVLVYFSTMAFSFRVQKWAVAPVAQPIAHTTLGMTGLSAKAILVRCSCDIRLMVENEQWARSLDLPGLGARFRAMRVSINMTQKQMAAEIGITKVAYTRMESGTKISAEVLFRCLLYYSRLINLDVLFDKRLWELAQQDHDLLYKKVHISSVVHRKHQLLKESLVSDISVIRQVMDERIDLLLYRFENGINSILSLTEE